MLQLIRLEGGHALAAEAVNAGDLGAIDPLLKVPDRIDRYRKAETGKAVYDAAARKRLFAKLSELAALFASEVRAAAEALEPSWRCDRP